MSDSLRHRCGLAIVVTLSALCWWVWTMAQYALRGTLFDDLGMVFAGVAVVIFLSFAEKLEARL